MVEKSEERRAVVPADLFAKRRRVRHTLREAEAGWMADDS